MSEFGTGMMDVIRFIFDDIHNWRREGGRIVGVVLMVGIWGWIGHGCVSLFKWVIA